MAGRFAVIGLGRFGLRLATELTRAGAEVIAVDKDRKIIEAVSPEVTVAVRMDSTDEEALRAQNIHKVDVAIVSIGQDFESNILTTVTLKAMGVPRVCCRAEKETYGRILLKIGADEVIFPEEESALRWCDKLITPHISDKMEFAAGYSLVQYTAPERFFGKNLQQLDLRRKYRVNLIGLRRAPTEEEIKRKGSGEVISVPLPDTMIEPGDVLWLVGSDADLSALPSG